MTNASQHTHRSSVTQLVRRPVVGALRAFSLIEMMIAIVILGLGLVMTATMFPVAWTRARTLTEYTTQRNIAQNAAALISESLHPAGSSFRAYTNQAGFQVGGYFVSTASLAGDLVFDSQLQSQLPPDELEKCVLTPSDTRVHTLHMENLLADAQVSSLSSFPERPFQLEQMFAICDNSTPPKCEKSFLNTPIPAKCAESFYSRSYFAPQVSINSRLYPPIDDIPDANASELARATWLEKFSTRRYAWAVLHRFKNYVGPDYYDVRRFVLGVPPPTLAEKKQFAQKASVASGTTRLVDFYIATLKRPGTTSRYAQQSRDAERLPNADRNIPFTPAPLLAADDTALPVAWRVQVEFPRNYPTASTGVPTEVQVPSSRVTVSESETLMLAGMFPNGSYFIDEITGLVYRVTRRRTNATNVAFLTLDREVRRQDVDDSDADQLPDPNAQVDEHETLRTVWVYPPPVSERPNNNTVIFEDASPVVGIDIRTISMTPPG